MDSLEKNIEVFRNASRNLDMKVGVSLASVASGFVVTSALDKQSYIPLLVGLSASLVPLMMAANDVADIYVSKLNISKDMIDNNYYMGFEEAEKDIHKTLKKVRKRNYKG